MTSLDSTRFARARLALEGLSIGDAFGERFFVHPMWKTWPSSTPISSGRSR